MSCVLMVGGVPFGGGGGVGRGRMDDNISFDRLGTSSMCFLAVDDKRHWSREIVSGERVAALVFRGVREQRVLWKAILNAYFISVDYMRGQYWLA
jgi:hypothetical protein